MGKILNFMMVNIIPDVWIKYKKAQLMSDASDTLSNTDLENMSKKELLKLIK